jgi:DNA repair exonuclease SbcCD ATPase subunit
MDPGSVGALIPVAAILMFGAVKIAKIQAQARGGRTGATGPEANARLEAVEAELGTLRQELGEVHERLDFAERLLAQHAPTRLNPPA